MVKICLLCFFSNISTVVNTTTTAMQDQIEFNILGSDKSKIHKLNFIKVVFLYNGNIQETDLIQKINYCKNAKDIYFALKDFHFEEVSVEESNNIFYISIKDSIHINSIAFEVMYSNGNAVLAKTYDKPITLGFYNCYMEEINLPQIAYQYKKQINSRDLAFSLNRLKDYFTSSGYSNVSVDYRVELDEQSSSNILKYYIFLDGFKKQKFIFNEKERRISSKVYTFVFGAFFDKKNLYEFFNKFDLRYLNVLLIHVENIYQDNNYHNVDLDCFYNSFEKALYLDVKKKVQSKLVLGNVKYGKNIELFLDQDILSRIQNVLDLQAEINIVKLKIQNILENYYFNYDDYVFKINDEIDNNCIKISIIIVTKDLHKKALGKINVYGDINYLNSNSIHSMLNVKLGDMVALQDLNNVKYSFYPLNVPFVNIQPVSASENSYDLNIMVGEHSNLEENLANLTFDSTSGFGFGPSFQNIFGSLWNIRFSMSSKKLFDLRKLHFNGEITRDLIDHGSCGLKMMYENDDKGFAYISTFINNLNLYFYFHKGQDDSNKKGNQFSLNRTSLSYIYFSSLYLLNDIESYFATKPLVNFIDKDLDFGLLSNICFKIPFEQLTLFVSFDLELSTLNQERLNCLYSFNSFGTCANKSLNIFKSFDNASKSWLGMNSIFRINIPLLPCISFFGCDLFFALQTCFISESFGLKTAIIGGIQTNLFYVSYHFPLSGSGVKYNDSFSFGISYQPIG